MKVGKYIATIFVFLLTCTAVSAQELPPGWSGFVQNPTFHVFSLYGNAYPIVNGEQINDGDYIGAFYYDGATLKCGGAAVYTSNYPPSVFAYGDDAFTPGRDGFYDGDSVYWKVYSYEYGQEFDVNVSYKPISSFDVSGLFHTSAISIIDNMASGSFVVFTYTSDYQMCKTDNKAVTIICSPIGGSGNYSYSWTSNPLGINSNEQSFTLTPQESVVFTVEVNDGTTTALGMTSVIVIQPPNIEYVNAASVCADNNFYLTPTVTNAATVNWSTSGDGFFSNTSSAYTTYHPGYYDILNEGVQLVLRATTKSPCYDTVYHNVNLSIIGLPVVNFSAPQYICSGETLELEAYTKSVSYVLWGTSGDGTFSNYNNPQSVYTPGINDIANGQFVISIMGEPVAPCNHDAFFSSQVAIRRLPSAYSGSDRNICENSVCDLHGIAANYSSVFWSTDGDGMFVNGNSINSQYVHGNQDVINGSVSITLNVVAVTPCDAVAVDALVLNIQPLADVAVGEDVSICAGSVADVSCVASDYSQITWRTTGDGSFSDIHTLTARYTPGTQDVITGMAKLIVAATSLLPCNIAVEDTLLLTIYQNPVVFAGENISILMGATAVLAGEVSGGSGTYNYQWQPAAFVQNPQMLTTETVELFSSKIFTLTAVDAQTTCSNNDNVIVSVYGELLEVEIIIDDDTVCIGETATITALSSGGSQNHNYSWTSNPQGFVSTDQIITVMPMESTYYILTVDDGISTVVDSVLVTVNALPLVFAGENISIYPGATAIFNASAVCESGNCLISWTPSSLLENPTSINPTTVPLFSDTQFVLFVNDELSGCFNTDTINVFVIGELIAVTAEAVPDSICYGSETVLTAYPTGGTGNYSFAWTSEPAGFYSIEETVTVSPEQTTRYFVAVDDEYTSAEATVDVKVFQLPNTVIVVEDSNDTVCYDSDVTLTAYCADAAEFLWLPYNLEGATITIDSLYFVMGNNKVYVKTTDVNGCMSLDSACFYVETCLGIDEVNPETIVIYPNPFDEIIYIETVKNTVIDVFDIIGRIIYSQKTDEKIVEINTNNWQSGVYIVRAGDGSKYTNFKMIKR